MTDKEFDEKYVFSEPRKMMRDFMKTALEFDNGIRRLEMNYKKIINLQSGSFRSTDQFGRDE